MASSGTVQSIDRIFDILEMLSSCPQGMLLTELSSKVGLHVSTTHRLVNMLVERGYAIKEAASGKYRLTLRTFEIGCRVSGIWDLMTMARPCLDDLAAQSQEAVHLVERDGSGVVYLYKAEPFHPLVRMGSHYGLRNPMYCTGVGKSILALLPGDEVARIWNSEPVTAFSPNTITDLNRLHLELEITRQRGFAIDNEEHEPGVRCMAVAIRNWQGTPVAAVSISAPVSRLEDARMEKLLPQLQSVASQISAMLGWRDIS